MCEQIGAKIAAALHQIFLLQMLRGMRVVEGDMDILTPLKSMPAIKPRPIPRVALSPPTTNAFPFAEAVAEEVVELHISIRNKLLEAQSKDFRL